MKLIIAGPRDSISYWHYSIVLSCLYEIQVHHNMPITEIVCGKAKGIDTWGEIAANTVLRVPVKYFPAQWDKYGKRAGHLRNAEMADYGDALLLVWGGTSPGSGSMKKIALNKKLIFFEKLV